MIAITQKILKEYNKFKINQDKSDCDFNILEGFFLNFQPFVVSIDQMESIGYDKTTIIKLIQEGATLDKLNSRIVQASTEKDLIKKSKLKLLLTETTHQSSDYITINILEDSKIKKRYSGTYKKTESRHIAKKHIKTIIEDKKNIEIFDTYMSSITNYSTNQTLLNNILPNNSVITLFIRDEENLDHLKNDQFRDELKDKRNDLTIKWEKIDSNMHDRYIKAGDITILLSSGLYYLQKKTKDFTYIISTD